MAIYLSRKKGSGGGGNLQSNKTITATTSQQIVQPDSGYDGLEQVTVNPQEHTQTYTPADDTASNDMGVNNNYRYVDTSGMVTPTSITPSNASPAALTSGSAVNPTANGYAIASYNTVMPSGVPTSVSSGDIVKISGGFNSVIVDKDDMHDIKGSNTSPERLFGGSLAKIWGNDPTVVTGYAIASYTPITPSTTPTSISQGDMVQVNGSGVIVTPTSVTPSDSTPPQLSQGGIYIPTSNGYLYENQQGGSVEPNLVEQYKNVANNDTKTITVSQMPKYITYFYTYYASANGGMFLILDVANNKAYRYGYWGSAFHNEDYTSGYSSYITSVSASSVTIKNSYGSAGNIAIGIYY